MELEHEGKYTLAVCCSNAGEDIEGRVEHRIFIVPDKPVIRKLFKKIDVRNDLEKLTAALEGLFTDSQLIDGIRIEAVA